MTTLASKANSFGWTPCQGCQLTGSDLGRKQCEKKIKNIPKSQVCLGFVLELELFASFSCRDVCSPILFGMTHQSISDFNRIG